MAKPYVNESECIGCSACVETCPVSCFEMQEDKAKTPNADACVDCKACEEGCPTNCITVK